MGERRRALVVSGLAVALVLWPAVRPDQRDSFPLSSYPMFSFPRERETELPTVVAVDGDGTARLSPELIAGTDEVIVTFHTVRRAIGAGPAATTALCEEVAQRLRASGRRSGTVRVVTERHDNVAFLAGETEPLDTTVHAECPA